MPSYDYVCEACEHKFEEFQSIKADPLKKCPECGKLKLQRTLALVKPVEPRYQIPFELRDIGRL